MIGPDNLHNYSLFGGISEEQIQDMLPLLTYEEYEPGAQIIVEGTPNDKIRFIIDGSVYVKKEGMVLVELKQGDTFGEMEVLDIMPSIATIEAVNKVSAMSISNMTLLKIYRTDVKLFALLIMNLARDISRRLRRMDEIQVANSLGK
jgi:CRP-like cAMP-binding protein